MGNSLSVMAIPGAPDATGVSQTGHEGPTTAGGGAGATEAGNQTAVAPTQAGVGAVAEAGTAAKTTETEWVPLPCGLEGTDGPGWKKWEGPKRYKESILTPEETQKFQEIVARVFHPDTVEGVRIVFSPDDVDMVLDKFIIYMENEPMLIEDVPYPIQVVGDLHGQLYDLARIFDADAVDGKPGWECAKYLFLGDYVDRGRHSIEIMMALFCLKMLFPDRIFLLRGNHEFSMINYRYGFLNEFWDRYEDDETAEELHTACNVAFGYLSIAAIIGDTYFCSHGGISPSAFTRRSFRVIPKPVMFSGEYTVVHDTCWSDPAIGLKGSCFNKDRGTSVFYGADQLSYALDNMDVKACIRGHSRVDEGFEVNWSCCISIFGATDTSESSNHGATCLIDKDLKYEFRVFELDLGRIEVERALFRIERPWDINHNELPREKGAQTPKPVVEDEKTVGGGEEDDKDLGGIRRFPG